ncbi:hypothetical protein BACFIN_08604 [Bacteroides finegoldii DSM 17565]|nr:hypothetical protein BACFIN_08604 [Bacteroides finegoldii DSM 17565]
MGNLQKREEYVFYFKANYIAFEQEFKSDYMIKLYFLSFFISLLLCFFIQFLLSICQDNN